MRPSGATQTSDRKNNEVTKVTEKVTDVTEKKIIGLLAVVLWDTDFSGKTIAPFCTSGGSGLSGTPGTIAELEAGAVVLDGLHISGSSADSAESSVSEWLGRIGLAK